MTNNIRVFLWLGLALAVWLNYSQWQQDYGPKPVAPAIQAPGAPKPTSMEDTVPQAAQSAPPAPTTGADAVPAAAAVVPAATPDSSGAVESAGLVHVTTDVL